MTGHGKRSEGSEISAVLQCEEAEGYNDQQDSFLMHMPAKEEGSVAAECQSANKDFPRWFEEKLDEWWLQGSVKIATRETTTYCLCRQSHDESQTWRDVRQDCKICISDQTSGDAVDSVLIDRQSQIWSGFTWSVASPCLVCKSSVHTYCKSTLDL